MRTATSPHNHYLCNSLTAINDIFQYKTMRSTFYVIDSLEQESLSVEHQAPATLILDAM